LRVVDLTEDRKDLFCLCLEDWSDEAKEAGPKRCEWLERGQRLGVKGKLALDETGVDKRQIQYGPIEHSFVDGAGLYFIYCIHVHGHQKGRGDFRKRGMGRALLFSAEEDARQQGAKGMAAWGLAIPVWMQASWFRKHGYRKADRQGMSELVWKPFAADARPPHWFPNSGKLPEPTPGKVNLTAFTSGWCMVQNLVYERAKRAATEFGDAVAFREIDTSSREAVAEWGRSDEVLLDGKSLQKGPPPSYEAIRKAIAKRVRKLQRGRRSNYQAGAT